MFPKALSAVVAIAASTLVSAQTYTDCNPLKTTCPADPAFGGNEASCDFTKGACDAFHLMDGTSLTYDGKGAAFTITKDGQAPTVRTDNYLFFGRVDVVVQAAKGTGIVTSAVLQSDDLDEIDWEWVGGDDAQVQTNYFSKGDTSTYDRGAYHPVSAPLTSYHKYTIEWTSQAINWLIDDSVVRTLTYEAAKGGSAFPQTPMQVKLGTWVAGGANNAEGTIEWAGGKTDFSQAPFVGYYKSITIVDYAGQDGPSENTNVKEYVYGDNSGTAGSIEIVKGDGSSGSSGGSKTTKAAASTTKAVKQRETSTKVPEPTTTKAPTTTVEKPKTTKTTAAEEETTSVAKKTTAKETKPVVHTTFSTVTAPSATTPSGSETTGSSGSSSGSGSGSGSSSSGSSGSTTSSGAGETITPVPASAASRMVGNTAMAVVALLAIQLFV